MKKVLKISLSILLIILLAFVITGCGAKNNKEENSKSKTYNVLNNAFSGENYIMTLEGNEDIGEGLENVVTTLAIKGEDIYIDIDATSNHMTIMYKNDTTYVISHDDKMYMTSEGKNEEIFEDDIAVMLSKEDLSAMERADYETGKEVINGTEYDYEEYKDEETGEIDRYYFSGEDLIYIKTIDENGEEDIMKVIKLSPEVDDNIFNIPTEYEKSEV